MAELTVEFSDLSFCERMIAASVVGKVVERFGWPRARSIFRALARGEALRLVSSGSVDMRPSLLRDERRTAASVQLAFAHQLEDDESVERVIECLGRSDALFGALICHGLMTTTAGSEEKWVFKEEGERLH